MREKSLALNSTIYLVVSFLQKALSFLLLPLYTRYLSPAEYGEVSVVNTLISILSVLFNLSLHGAASRFYYRYRVDEARVRRIWGSTLTFVLLNTIVLAILLAVFHSVLLDPFAESISFSPLLALGLLTAGLSPVYLFFQTRLQAMQDGAGVGRNSLAYFVLNVSLSVLLLVVFDAGAAGIIGATALTNLVFFFLSLARLFPHIDFGIDWSILKATLKYGLPLIPYNLASLVAIFFDRLFINASKGASQVGIYSVGFQFANIVNIVSAGIAQAYSPWFFHRLEEGEEGRASIRRVAVLAISFINLTGIGLTLLAVPLLGLVAGTAFADGRLVVPFLSLGYSVYGGYQILCNGLFSKKTQYLPIVTFVGAILSVGMNIILVPKLGMMGAAVTSLVQNVVMTIVVAILAEFVEPVGYRYERMIWSYLIVTGFSVVAFGLMQYSSWVSLILNVLAFLVAIILYLILHRDDLLNFLGSGRLRVGK